MTGHKIDSVDCKIISILRKNARASFAEISEIINLHAGVVKARYNKMKKTGLILGSSLVIDWTRLGMIYAAYIGLEVDEQSVLAIKNFLDGLEIENGAIETNIVFGSFNILVGLFVCRLDDVFKVKDTIRQLDGVKNIEISIAKDTIVGRWPTLNIDGLMEELCHK